VVVWFISLHRRIEAQVEEPGLSLRGRMGPFDYSYFTGKWPDSKSCVIQTFSAKIRLNLEVFELAR
jgi:hypothetical protein